MNDDTPVSGDVADEDPSYDEGFNNLLAALASIAREMRVMINVSLTPYDPCDAVDE